MQVCRVCRTCAGGCAGRVCVRERRHVHTSVKCSAGGYAGCVHDSTECVHTGMQGMCTSVQGGGPGQTHMGHTGSSSEEKPCKDTVSAKAASANAGRGTRAILAITAEASSGTGWAANVSR